MSVQPEEFLSQSPSAFLDQPSFLEQGPQTPVQPKVEDSPDFLKIALGIAAAVVVLRLLVRAELFKENPRTQEEIDEAARRIYRKIFPVWMHVSVPTIAQAYRLGATETISYIELEKMATAYAEELGDYIHETSILALTDGFNAQVNAGWSERLAWQRAREAYGLDAQQMRSYVKGLAAQDKGAYVTDPIPASSRAMVDRLFLIRADRLGTNEAFRATQLGRNLVWLSLQASGQIPDGTMKRWVTAEDERVCPVCGPLHMVEIPLHRRFTSAGRNFYSPGVHPNCRCWLEIVYPEDDLRVDVVKAMPGDPYNRDAEGQFARREERKAANLTGTKTLTNTATLTREATLTGSKEATLTGQAEATLTGRRESSLVSDMLRDEDLARQAEATAVINEAAAKKEAAAMARALTEGDVESAVNSAKRNLDARKHQTRQRTFAMSRTLRPEDPQLHMSTAYLPATHYMTTRRVSPNYFVDGAVVQLGVRDGSDIERIPAWHEVDGGEDSPVDDYDIVNSDSFSDAFDTYMELPEGGYSFISGNRLASIADQKITRTYADYSMYGNGSDPKFTEQRKAMAGMSQVELLDFADRTLRRSIDAADRFEISDVEDEPANTIAAEIMWALEQEDSENQRWRKDFGRDRNSSPWLTALSELAEERGTVDKDVEEVIATVRTLRENYSDKQKVTPVFFRIPNWYGVIPQKNVSTPLGLGKLTEPGYVSGTYEVYGDPVRLQVPLDLRTPEVDDAIDGVLVVNLRYASPDVPTTEVTDEGR